MNKKVNLPRRLYKFRSLKSGARPFTESIFRKNQVWYARASTFNDPFDCDHFIDVDRNAMEWKEIMQRFEKQFTQAALLGPGLLLQGFWNAIVENYNEKAVATSGKKLPKLTQERLLQFTDKMSRKAQLTIGNRVPSEIVNDVNAGPEKLNKVLARYFAESRRAVDQRFGVFSLASSPDNILMWSHYADEHTGICIEFDTESHPGAFPNSYAVEYCKDSPVIEKRFANILMNLQQKDPSADKQFLARIARRDLEAEWTDREIRTWFLTKSELWNYENEWRSIVPGPGLKKIPAAAISGVILGCKTSQQSEAMVRDWIRRRRRKVKLYRASKQKGVFGLDINPL